MDSSIPLNTNMVKEAYGYHWFSADKGASILHELVTSDNYKGATGKYYDNDQGAFGIAHVGANKQTAIDRLIEATKTIVKINRRFVASTGKYYHQA